MPFLPTTVSAGSSTSAVAFPIHLFASSYNTDGVSTTKLPDVFDYLDYRVFLRDWYRIKKARKSLSYRRWSQQLQLRSPNFMKLVLDGERNLTEEMAMRVAKTIPLKTKEERDFFLEIVRFTQGRSVEVRDAAFQRLSRFRNYQQVHPLTEEQLRYHSTWYMPAIRELAIRSDFRDDPQWIARTLVPSITAEEASEALELLLKLGLLERTNDGGTKQGTPLVTTGPDVQWIHVGRYLHTMIKMASRALDEVSTTERDISSLTLCLPPSGISEVKEKIGKFRRELLVMSEAHANPTQVVQVNFQLFPLSKPK